MGYSPWSRKNQTRLNDKTTTTTSIVAWKIHGQRSLVGYSLQGRKESDTNEQLRAMVQREPRVMINPILHT